MRKLGLVFLLFMIASFLSGCYGAVHHQVLYSLSPEYFTNFKFQQFRLDNRIPDILRVAIVGWNEAYWMGLVIGFFLIPYGLFIRGNSTNFWSMMRAFGVVAMTALIVGLFALAISFVVIDIEVAGEISRYSNEIKNDVAFARALTLHNSSFLGGLVGILPGAIALFWDRRGTDSVSRDESSECLKDLANNQVLRVWASLILFGILLSFGPLFLLFALASMFVHVTTPVEMTGTTIDKLFYRINLYAMKNNRLPPTIEDVPEDYGRRDWTIDGWGHKLTYTISDKGYVTITSFGADNTLGGEGRNKDISVTYKYLSEDGDFLANRSTWSSDSLVSHTLLDTEQSVAPKTRK